MMRSRGGRRFQPAMRSCPGQQYLAHLSPSRRAATDANESVTLPPLALAAAAPTGVIATLPPPSPPPRRSLRHPRPSPPYNVQSFSSTTSRSKKRSSDTSSKSSSASKRRRINLKKPPPTAVEDIDSKPKAREDGDKKPAAATAAAATTSATPTCTICMCEPDRTEIASIDGCEHLYCFSCIEKWSQRENTCPNCKSRFTQIKRLVPQRKKSGTSSPSVKNTKKVKQRDQRSDLLNGAALESILANIAGRVAREGGTHFGRFRFFAAHVGAASRPPSGPGARMGSSSVFPPSSFFGLGGPDDEDEDDEFRDLVPPFMSAILRSAGSLNSDLRNSTHGYSLHAAHAPRSHATNGDDVTAGLAADNPLEITTSDDDDDDDEVEVIEVVMSGST